MAFKEIFIALLAVGIVVCEPTKECSSIEKIKHCWCWERSEDAVDFQCFGSSTNSFEYTLEEYSKLFQKTLSGRRNITLTIDSFTKESRLPSKVFDGLHLKELKIKDSKVSRWADTEGGPAFVGLEDTLEKLQITRTLWNSRRKNSYGRVDSPAQFTLGHLRKLKEINYENGDINTLGNDWFENGPNSLEILALQACRMEVLGDRAFANLPNLKRVIAWSNGVERLTRSMFPNPANHLEVLDFDFNDLSYLSDDLFTNMPALKRIQFFANPLKYLPETTWRPVWSRLDYLNVGNNRMECKDFPWIFEAQQHPKEVYVSCYDEKEGLTTFNEIMRKKQRNRKQ